MLHITPWLLHPARRSRAIPRAALLGVALLALAAVLRLRGYDFALPYLDHPDEPNFALTALWWRGELRVFQNPGYPPAYIWLQMAVQAVMDALGTPAIPDYVRVMRLLSVAASLGTTAIITRTAWRVGGWTAAFLAGVVWATAPEIVEGSLYATSDPFVYLLVSASTLLAVEAISEPGRSAWALWSVLVALAATLVKYPAVPAIVPGAIAALVVLGRDRRTGRYLLLLQVACVAVVGAWLVGVYGIPNYNEGATFHREGATFQSQGLERITSPDLVRQNLALVFYPLARATWTFAGWGVAIAGTILALVTRRRTSDCAPHPATLAALWAVMVLIPWIATSFRAGNVQAIRDILPGTTAAVVLWSAGLVLIGRTAAALLRQIGLPRRAARHVVTGGLIAAFLIVYLIPQLVIAWQESTLRTYPDTRADLAAWAEIALDPGTIVVTDENHKTFNRYWGGYPGKKWFDSWVTDDVTEHPPDVWRERGMSYLVMPYTQVLELQQTDTGRAYLARLFPLRSVAPQKQQRGPAVIVFRLWGPDHQANAEFGGQIRLVGWDQQPAVAQPGDTLALRFYWQPVTPPRDNYSVFLHLTPSTDPTSILAQADFTPVSEARLPLTWHYPDETLVGQTQHLTIPADLPPGSYVARLGLYNYVTGERLRVSTGSGSSPDHILLFTLDLRGG